MQIKKLTWEAALKCSFNLILFFCVSLKKKKLQALNLSPLSNLKSFVTFNLFKYLKFEMRRFPPRAVCLTKHVFFPLVD